MDLGVPAVSCRLTASEFSNDMLGNGDGRCGPFLACTSLTGCAGCQSRMRNSAYLSRSRISSCMPYCRLGLDEEIAAMMTKTWERDLQQAAPLICLNSNQQVRTTMLDCQGGPAQLHGMRSFASFPCSPAQAQAAEAYQLCAGGSEVYRVDHRVMLWMHTRTS